jgi:hypothetical protein
LLHAFSQGPAKEEDKIPLGADDFYHLFRHVGAAGDIRQIKGYEQLNEIDRWTYWLGCVTSVNSFVELDHSLRDCGEMD